MTATESPQPDLSAQAAIEQVLRAERLSEDVVAQARARSHAMLAAAADRAARTSARARERIALLHERSELKLRQDIDALGVAAAADQAGEQPDERRLQRLADTAASWLVQDDAGLSER